MTGFIYAIESAGRVKIGFSKNPETRINKVASDSPFPCEMLGYWPGTVADELDVHAKFSAERVHGEWFEASNHLLSFIAANTAPFRKGRSQSKSAHPLIAFSSRTGRSITSIAKDAGCSRMTLYRIMNGGNTTTDQLKRISAATGGAVTVGALLEASSNVFGPLQKEGAA